MVIRVFQKTLGHVTFIKTCWDYCCSRWEPHHQQLQGTLLTSNASTWNEVDWSSFQNDQSYVWSHYDVLKPSFNVRGFLFLVSFNPEDCSISLENGNCSWSSEMWCLNLMKWAWHMTCESITTVSSTDDIVFNLPSHTAWNYTHRWQINMTLPWVVCFVSIWRICTLYNKNIICLDHDLAKGSNHSNWLALGNAENDPGKKELKNPGQRQFCRTVVPHGAPAPPSTPLT